MSAKGEVYPNNGRRVSGLVFTDWEMKVFLPIPEPGDSQPDHNTILRLLLQIFPLVVITIIVLIFVIIISVIIIIIAIPPQSHN